MRFSPVFSESTVTGIELTGAELHTNFWKFYSSAIRQKYFSQSTSGELARGKYYGECSQAAINNLTDLVNCSLMSVVALDHDSRFQVNIDGGTDKTAAYAVDPTYNVEPVETVGGIFLGFRYLAGLPVPEIGYSIGPAMVVEFAEYESGGNFLTADKTNIISRPISSVMVRIAAFSFSG